MADTFGDRLRRARVASALTQDELARKIGASQPAVATWESGNSNPKSTFLARLEKTLGTLGSKKKINDDFEDVPPPTGAVAAWLRKERTSAKMSIPELAEASGLSLVTIYNIESGKSPNPQAETRRRLEKALKTTVPTDVQKEAADEQKVPGVGTLQSFDPHNRDQLPDLPGVYVFYDISDRPVYIGKADNIASRVKNHEEKKWFIRPIVENGSYIEIQDANLRHSVEQVLIKFLRSNAIINKQSVDR